MSQETPAPAAATAELGFFTLQVETYEARLDILAEREKLFKLSAIHTNDDEALHAAAVARVMELLKIPTESPLSSAYGKLYIDLILRLADELKKKLSSTLEWLTITPGSTSSSSSPGSSSPSTPTWPPL